MTTIQEILSRPDMRESRKHVQELYAVAHDADRVAAGYARGFSGSTVADRKADESVTADEAHSIAQRAYCQMVNRACRDAGLPDYVGMVDPYGEEK